MAQESLWTGTGSVGARLKHHHPFLTAQNISIQVLRIGMVNIKIVVVNSNITHLFRQVIVFVLLMELC